MKSRNFIVGLACVLAAYYFELKARNAKTRNTRIIDEITADAFSIAANLIKG